MVAPLCGTTSFTEKKKHQKIFHRSNTSLIATSVVSVVDTGEHVRLTAALEAHLEVFSLETGALGLLAD